MAGSIRSIVIAIVLFAVNVSAFPNKEVIPSKTSEFERVACTLTRFADVAAATRSCTDITIKDMVVPGGQILDLGKLKDGTKVTFAGKTTFQYADINIIPIELGGKGITVEGAPGHVIDGNGPAWWDGEGSNGGMEKPNHFISLKRMVGNSVVRNLYVYNFPVHCVYITQSRDLIVENIVLNNTLGDLPNQLSEGKAAGHNTDGFGVAASDNIVIRNSKVWNQDDCVAVTSGYNITVENMYCYGGHGLSIGSVGGKSNNTVKNVVFRNSVLVNQENGIRIKTNSETTGTVSGITFENIRIEGATKYGLVIQQDYLNGGPTGEPTNGVAISDITIKNVTGTATGKARNYYILCGDGSCTNFKISDTRINGGSRGDYCNYKGVGNFQCPSDQRALE